MLTIRSAFGTPAAWDFWSRMGIKWMVDALASGDSKKIENEMQSQFMQSWDDAAGKARTSKAKVAAKKDGAKVRHSLALAAGVDYCADTLLIGCLMQSAVCCMSYPLCLRCNVCVLVVAVLHSMWRHKPGMQQLVPPAATSPCVIPSPALHVARMSLPCRCRCFCCCPLHCTGLR
jgi:hypothetical protein